MKRGSQGTTLVEMLLALTMFSVMLTAAYLFLDQGVKLWKNVSGSESSGLDLKRVQTRLERDMLETSFASARVTDVPASLPGGAPDGRALSFLSALDDEGNLIQKDGVPFWQRNVLYYLVVPAGHTECAGGAGPAGTDDRCVHKILIRKVIDTGTPTTPDGDLELTVEAPLLDVTPYLTRPAGSSLESMLGVEPGLESATVVAKDLLSWDVLLSPDPRSPGEVEIDLRDVAVEEARNHVKLGVDSLAATRFTVNYLFSVVPRN